MENKLYMLKKNYYAAETTDQVGVFDDSMIEEVEKICDADSDYSYDEIKLNDIPVVAAYKIVGYIVPDKDRKPVVRTKVENVVVDKDTVMDVFTNSTVYTRDRNRIDEFEDMAKAIQTEAVKNTPESDIQEIFSCYIGIADIFKGATAFNQVDSCDCMEYYPTISLNTPMYKDKSIGDGKIS